MLGVLVAGALLFASLRATPLVDGAEGAANGVAESPRVRDGFKLELVYAPPLKTQGSWVSLTVDDRGRLIASDQYGALYRVSPSAIGGPASKSRVERIPAKIGSAQGLAFVNGALYAMVNSTDPGAANGLFRVRDSNGDDTLDQVEQLLPLRGTGEHAQHAVVASPDGRSLYLCAGNYAPSPSHFAASRVPGGWSEDQLLPRIDDPAEQSAGVPAPGGWIVRTDLDGGNCELFSLGYRNIYDMAFNGDGELFTFESDLDVDIGTPWYRLPSLLHVTSGADYGWRGGDGLWPPYYPDTLPPAATAPPGSPTGLASSAGSAFPPEYQSAMFAGDWGRGAVFAVRLTPTGASYRGDCEPIVEGVSGVTDLVVNPQDGALYFTVGGRRVESKLYRLVWTGKKASGEELVADKISDDANMPAGADGASAVEARARRAVLERFHLKTANDAGRSIWPSLSSADRFIRYAALTALERTDPRSWYKQALEEPNVLAKFTALIALTRRNEPAQADDWVSAIVEADFAKLTKDEQQTVLRAAALGVMRFKRLSPATLERLAAGVAPWFPTNRPDVDRELAKLLVRLKSPTIVEPLAHQLTDAASSEQQVGAAIMLSAATAGWTPATRTALLDWFDAAAERHGHRSFYPYLTAARKRFIAGFSTDERKTYAARLAPPSVKSGESVAVDSPRNFVKAWTVDQVVAAANSSVEANGAILGRRLYAQLGCADCHAIHGIGASVGPNLTNVGRRYSTADLARAIVEPSDEIPDIYRQTTFVADGRSVTGRVTNMTADTISVTTDMRDPGSAVKLRRDAIETETPSPLSAMPSKLLETLEANEIAALFQFLKLGDAADPSGTAHSAATP